MLLLSLLLPSSPVGGTSAAAFSILPTAAPPAPPFCRRHPAFVRGGGVHVGASAVALCAAPRRFDDNADGVLYVNDKCINCAACSSFAPTTFSRSPSDGHHIVHAQPSADDPTQLDEARAALAACPVAAIRVENSARLNHANKGDRLSPHDEHLAKQLAISPKLNGLELPFPRPLLPDVDTGVHFLGSHNDKSFGATPYLVRGKSHTGRVVSVMVDTPKFTPTSVRAVQSLTDNAGEAEAAEAGGSNEEEEEGGPDYLFLTHVDDTADHLKWRNEFPNRLKRIFHDGDLGRHNWLGDLTLEDVEVLLHGETDVDTNAGDAGAEEQQAEEQQHKFKAWNLDGEEVNPTFNSDGSWPDGVEGDFVILHTPGHSPGSISLLYRSTSDGVGGGLLFTGDTYAYTTREGGHMSGFPRYGNDLSLQAKVLRELGTTLSDQFDIVAPGHGHVRSYLGDDAKEISKSADIEEAVEELIRYR